MYEEVVRDKKQKLRVFKVFRQYHDAFVEHLIINLIRNVDELNLKGVMLVMVNGNIKGMKRRSNSRLMHVFVSRGLNALKNERHSLGIVYEKIACKYYDMAYRFSLKPSENRKLIREFKNVLGLDIKAMIEKLSPMGSGEGGINIPWAD
jgi:hypothetical protein